MVALGRVVLTRREHVIALEPRGKGLLGMTLRYPYEVRDEQPYFEGIADLKLPKDMMDLASHIVSNKSGHFDPSHFEDRYENALIDLLKKREAGEKIVGEPHIGDSVRWNIAPAMYGTEDQATPVIILKPQMPGLDTNLLITTDRRAYYLRLISKPDDYVARVAFEYPQDDIRKWQQQLAAEQALAKQERHAAEVPPVLIAVENVNFDYAIRGGDERIRPLRVFDDGAKTFIQMPTDLQHREAPVLLVVGKDGKAEMTNYRVKDQTYIVDRLFDRANLVLGSGKRAQKVEISRGHKP